MAQNRPRYAAPLRAEAVELARTSGKSFAMLAHEFGLADQTLRNWVYQVAVDAGHGRPGELMTTERAELAHLPAVAKGPA